MHNFIRFMCWVTKRHLRFECFTFNAEIVIGSMLCQQAMTAAMVSQIFYAFATKTNSGHK